VILYLYCVRQESTKTMRVALLLLVLVVVLSVFCHASQVDSERHSKAKHGKKTSFRLLERVQRQREKERQKLKLDKQMIMQHVHAREKANKNKIKNKIHLNSKHSLATLSHGSEYAARRSSSTSALSNVLKLSSQLEKHHIKERESDALELKRIRHLLSNMDKTKNAKSSFLVREQHDMAMKRERQGHDDHSLDIKQKIAERRLKRMEKQEQDRREELLDGLSLGGTQSVDLTDTTDLLSRLQNVNFIETHADVDAAPAWADKPIWWKVPPSEITNADQAPWPNDPLYQNGYPATIIDPNNYPLSNVDDPNNYPALDDPNGAFAPIQQPH